MVVNNLGVCAGHIWVLPHPSGIWPNLTTLPQSLPLPKIRASLTLDNFNIDNEHNKHYLKCYATPGNHPPSSVGDHLNLSNSCRGFPFGQWTPPNHLAIVVSIDAWCKVQMEALLWWQKADVQTLWDASLSDRNRCLISLKLCLAILKFYLWFM